MRIGVVGGVPPAMGGGGLELQLRRTAAALRARGHEVVEVASAPAGTTWDVLHAFGGEGDVQHAVHHWSRTVTPLVVSPVVVVSPGRDERLLRVASALPAPLTIARGRRALLLRADAVIALTDYEAGLLRGVTGGRARVHVVGNGVDPVEPGASPVEPGFALLLGTVSARKRQADVVRALAGGPLPVVVAGGFEGRVEERRAFEAAVTAAGATWLGRLDDPAVVAALVTCAAVLVHLSTAEGQSLAVLEALAAGTPVVLSDIPSHEELAARFPGWVRVVSSDLGHDDVAWTPSGPPPVVPTWDDVAAQLEAVYAEVVAA